MVKREIWKDTYYTANRDMLDYTIQTATDVVFYGRAYRGSGDLKININRVCRDYLRNRMPDFSAYADNLVEHPEAFVTFFLMEGSTVLETYQFLYNWEFENSWNGESMTLSEPVNGHMAANMKILYSVFKEGTGETICWEEMSNYFHLPSDSFYALYNDTIYRITGCMTDLEEIYITSDSPWISATYYDGTITLNFSENSGDIRAANFQVRSGDRTYAHFTLTQFSETTFFYNIDGMGGFIRTDMIIGSLHNITGETDDIRIEYFPYFNPVPYAIKVMPNNSTRSREWVITSDEAVFYITQAARPSIPTNVIYTQMIGKYAGEPHTPVSEDFFVHPERVYDINGNQLSLTSVSTEGDKIKLTYSGEIYEIGEQAFYNYYSQGGSKYMQMQFFWLPNSVKKFDNQCFYYQGHISTIETVWGMQNASIVGSMAFENVAKMPVEEFTLPRNSTGIVNSGYNRVAIRKFIIPEGYTRIAKQFCEITGTYDTNYSGTAPRGVCELYLPSSLSVIGNDTIGAPTFNLGDLVVYSYSRDIKTAGGEMARPIARTENTGSITIHCPIGCGDIYESWKGSNYNITTIIEDL